MIYPHFLNINNKLSMMNNSLMQYQTPIMWTITWFFLFKVATSCLDSSLLKYSAKEYFFRASLCHLSVDLLNAQHALEKYSQQYPAFQDSREYKLVKVSKIFTANLYYFQWKIKLGFAKFANFMVVFSYDWRDLKSICAEILKLIFFNAANTINHCL